MDGKANSHPFGVGRRPSDKLIPALFIFLILIYSFGALASLMRMRFGDAGPIGLGYQRFMLPGLLLLAAMLVAVFKVRSANFSVILLSLMFAYATISGLYHNGMNSYFVSHAFQAGFAILLYMLGRQLMWKRPDLLRKWLPILAKTATVVHVPIMLVYTYWTMTTSIYLGMSASILILAALIFLVNRQFRWLALALILTTMTGKRGELIGLFLAIIMHIYMRGRLFGLGQMARQFMMFISFGAAALTLISLVAAGFLAAMFAKFGTIFMADFSDLSDPAVREAIGGRGVEMLIFYQTFIEPGLIRTLTGLGFGWNVPVNVIGYEETDVLHFVHISPLNTIGQYGLICAVIYWGMILNTIRRAIMWARVYPEYLVLTPYVAGMVFVSLTAYAISVEPMFWIALGAISLRAAHPTKGISLPSATSRLQARAASSQ